MLYLHSKQTRHVSLFKKKWEKSSLKKENDEKNLKRNGEIVKWQTCMQRKRKT